MNALMKDLPQLVMKTKSPNKGSFSLSRCLYMHDVAISIIHNYIEENLFSPSLSWDRYEFKKRSYEQWAAYEILERIMDHPFDMPVDIVEIFMFEMYYCAHFCGEDEPRTFIFQTAVSVAEDILLLFV